MSLTSDGLTARVALWLQRRIAQVADAAKITLSCQKLLELFLTDWLKLGEISGIIPRDAMVNLTSMRGRTLNHYLTS